MTNKLTFNDIISDVMGRHRRLFPTDIHITKTRTGYVMNFITRKSGNPYLTITLVPHHDNHTIITSISATLKNTQFIETKDDTIDQLIRLENRFNINILSEIDL